MSLHHHAARQATQKAKEKQYMHRLPPAEMFLKEKEKTHKLAMAAICGVCYLFVAVALLLLAGGVLNLFF